MTAQPVDSSILHEIVRVIESRRKVPEKVIVKSREYVLTYLEDHQRRLQPLCAMDGHHPDRIRRGGRVALHLHVALTEPGEEPVERGDFLLLERQRGGHQLLNRVACSLAKAAKQFAPPVQGSGQNCLYEARGSDKIGHGQPAGEDAVCLGPMRVLFTSGYTSAASVPCCTLNWAPCAFLQKPFNVDLLASAVRELLDRPG